MTEEKRKLLVEGFSRTIKNVFPKLGKWLNAINDPRCVQKITYHRSIMLWTGIFLFLFQLKSARSINFKLNASENFFNNFKSLFPLLGIQTDKPFERLPDYGTLNDMLKKLKPDELEEVLVKMVKRMIKKKTLEKFRLEGKYYLVAIDGSQILTFKERHCPNCLRRKIGTDEDGNPIYLYYHYVLAVKLVTPGSDGLAIPIISEFVENESPDVEKQDCEVKAFCRLLQRLKNYFPRTRICILLDSLYAQKPVFDLLKQYKFEYIVRFKKGSMPAFHGEYREYLPFFEENRAKYFNKETNKSQHYQWINNIEYKGHQLNVLECLETPGDAKNKAIDTNEYEKQGREFLWITSIPINYRNYKELANNGGRCRWKIENQGFKAQKREGYELEHAYSLDYNAIKCFYNLLQIAHTINQIIERGGRIKDITGTFGSKRNYYRMFFIAFSEYLIDEEFLNAIMQAAFQIRLDSS